MTTSTTARRAVLVGTATLPAFALPAGAAESSDPVIAAVRRWLAAQQAERAYHSLDGINFENDPHAAALEADFDAPWHAMAETRPTTPEGMALLMAVYAYDAGGHAQGAQIGDVTTWGLPGGSWSDDRDVTLLGNVFDAMQGAGLFGRIGA